MADPLDLAAAREMAEDLRARPIGRHWRRCECLDCRAAKALLAACEEVERLRALSKLATECPRHAPPCTHELDNYHAYLEEANWRLACVATCAGQHGVRTEAQLEYDRLRAALSARPPEGGEEKL